MLREYIHALPKVELHVHLVGSASVDTVLALAERHPEAGVPADRAELAAFYEFRDFDHFLKVSGPCSRCCATGMTSTCS